jgi:hypothetical protein
MILSHGHDDRGAAAREASAWAPPSDDDLLRAAEYVRDAVDDGRLDLEEAGQRLSATYRARSRRDLDVLVYDLVPDGPERTTPEDRAFYVWAAVRVTIFAAIAAVLLFAVLYTINPF